ncbi:hypothetical protein FBU30_006758 [Linnemannia zychae]|nr:hypothetical protein FBU30_006758 [Linnemannia zychae]
MRQLESSASLDSMTSSITSSSGIKDEVGENETQIQEETVSPRSVSASRSSVEHQESAQLPTKASSSSLQTSHHFDSVSPLPDKEGLPSRDVPGAFSPNRIQHDVPTPEAGVQTPGHKGGGSEQSRQQHEEHDSHEQNPQDETSYHSKTASNSPRSQQPPQQNPSPNSVPHPPLNNHPGGPLQNSPFPPQSHQHHSPHAQPLLRSTPPSPYYPSRPHHGPSKPFSGPQGQGPGVHGAVAPHHQGPPGYTIPPPPQFFASNPASVPVPGSRRPLVYPGQPTMQPGSHSVPLTDSRSGPPFHATGGYKHPYIHPGYPQEYQHMGYYQTPEGWRPIPTPTLQKKPKELDKAMWVGNVLNDTTVAELKAIFEAEPTEAEGDIPHDIPEATVDRAVQRFHDREFKSTRLVCRPRKDPVPDPYSNKPGPTGRFQSQLQQPQHLAEPINYYNGTNNSTVGNINNNDSSVHSQRIESGGAHPELSEVQSRLERMRLEGSPLLDSSSSGGEGSSLVGSGHNKRKPKVNQKKPRSSSSLGYAESRYFIMKSLNDEDLKLSAQFGLWATQEHLVPILNDAFSNSKNVYLIFSANKSGEFFGYARMMDLISAEKEAAIMVEREGQIWQPALDIPLSPEMKAAVLEEIEQAAREGRHLTFDEAEAISRASTTTKSWGIMFPVKWIHVHKVSFSKTAHMLNSYYDNREVKVSKDGTEVDPSVGEQLLGLFKKSNSGRKGPNGGSDTTSKTNSEAGGSRRSSVAGDINSLAPPATQRTASSRRSSVMSTRSTGSNSGDRRPSLDPSRSHGPGSKSAHSPHPSSHRNQFGTEGYQSPHSSSSGYRSSPRNQYNSAGSTPQGLYSDYPGSTQEHPRSGWNTKTNYRGNHGGYGPMPYGGLPHMQGGYYPQEHGNNYRKGGPTGGSGGKYNSNYHSGPHNNNMGTGGSYESSSFNSSHNNRRQGGSQSSTSPGHYRTSVSPPGTDGFKHGAGGSLPVHGNGGQPGLNDHNGYSAGVRGGPSPGGQGPSHPTSGMIPPHPGMYAAQGPHGAHYASFPPPGYPMMPPYMGYSYVPGPNPFMHGAMAWHPGQGPPMAGGMMPGPPIVSGHTVSLPMIPGAHGDVHGMEGMVPLIGYDGLTYGYVPAEEAYHQHMYGYGYIPHDPHAPERTGDNVEETQEAQDREIETEEGMQDTENDDETGVNITAVSGHADVDSKQARSRSLTESTQTPTQDEGDESAFRARTRTSRSISSSTVSSSSTLIPPPGGSRKKSTATVAAADSEEQCFEEEDGDDDAVLEIHADLDHDSHQVKNTDAIHV